MFILNPDPYLLPTYRISPFRTEDIANNNTLPDDNGIDEYFDNRFSGKRYQYTLNAREALNRALSNYHLQKDDFVTILTTSGNFYISGCVTKEVEKFCKWSRKIENNTKVIIVNHEFGYPYSDLRELAKMGIPIIEDCAHSFFSKDKDKTIGNIGDFVIYSLPKMFPIQIGGLLVTNSNYYTDKQNIIKKTIDEKSLKYIQNVLSKYIPYKEEIIEKRKSNYYSLKKRFESLGFDERFPLTDGIVPGVYMFHTNNGHSINLNELKNYFYMHGVQCSVFYGEETFFLPIHQALNEPDLDYFCEILKSFINLFSK